jgi:hypothetical protein
MVTAELAMALPVLVLLLAVGLGAVAVAGQRVRAQDAAREAARALARGDPASARRLVEQLAPGAAVSLSRSADLSVAQVSLVVRPPGGWPAVRIEAHAVAATEPEPEGSAGPVAATAGAPP